MASWLRLAWPLAIAGVVMLVYPQALPPTLPVACTLSKVACENQLPGNPESEWGLVGTGSIEIEGFTTDISVNVGSTVRFKIKTSAPAYTIDIYRMGWYGGNGARKVASVSPSVPLPQSQPVCLHDENVGLVDCGTWAESASWVVPSEAVSGVYFAKLRRIDNGEANHIVFIVRDDASHSKMVFQTSDTTWQAYNKYGGNSFYAGAPLGRAFQLSYNRPFTTRADTPNGQDWVFANEYPMLRWLERNGYDVSYISGVDTDRFGSLLLNHEVFLSVGHDEYWSGAQRANVEAARDAGVNLAFFSGNSVYWKTRYKPSIEGSNTPYRTLVTYKETREAVEHDGDPAMWTGTWRDPRFSPPGDGGQPENALMGTMYMANCCNAPIEVPETDGKMRLWRNTSVATQAPGGTATLAEGTLGYEFDEPADNGFQPPGLIHLSTTTQETPQYLLDWGSRVGNGTATHHLTLYRAASGALVFGAGTIQWAWGLDDQHDGPTFPTPDVRMQQATLNLFADMGVQPTTMQPELVAAFPSTDTTPPTATITSPAAGATLTGGTTATVTGTAADVGGRVAGVEVSTDDGITWHPATGRSSWSYTWHVQGFGPTVIKVRATDDSANRQIALASRTVDVTCPCTLFGGEEPDNKVDIFESNPIQVGVKFRSDFPGSVTGVRFYKGQTQVDQVILRNDGVHTGSLWRTDGTRLATGTFTNETATGWQTLQFASPVPIEPNTTYIASYFAPNGHYAADRNEFNGKGVDAFPLHAPPDGLEGPNGVYAYGGDVFPTDTFGASDYGVDVILQATYGPDTYPPAATPTNPGPGATIAPVSTTVQAVFSENVQPETITVAVTSPGGGVSGSTGYNPASRTVTFTPSANLAYGTTYTATVSGAQDLAGNVMAPRTWTFTTVLAPRPPGVCPCYVFPETTVPALVDSNDPGAVELGMRFRADADGKISGIRFYKSAANTGTHVGSLWTNTGTKLASVTFVGESASGWQQANFSAPVDVVAGQTYVASYHAPNGHYSANGGQFNAAVDNPPLHGLASGVDGLNGVYSYGPAGTFPTSLWNATNYWVDVVYSIPPDVTAPMVATSSPGPGMPVAPITSPVSATFDEDVEAGTAAIALSGPGGAVAGTSSYDAGARTITFTPGASLAHATTYTVTVSGARDAAGNTMFPTSWSFTTALASRPPGVCPCTLFDENDTSELPAIPAAADDQSVEVGMRFQPDTSGKVTAIRFYKGPGNTGTHVGNLWTSTGTKLATVTFGGETTTGWQQANLATPVEVTAGTTYVVSYLAPKGRYSSTPNHFASPKDNPPLHGLADTAGAGNGVFVYTATGGFPTGTWQQTNYWVDVVFEPPPDTTPPTLAAKSPPPLSTIATINTTISATFSEDVEPGSASIVVTDATGTVSGTTTYDAASRTARFTPTANLAHASTYHVAVTGAQDPAGNVMAPDAWLFTTEAAPPPPGTCPCRFFGGTDVPATAAADDPGSVEVGVRFRADVDGQITGIRFYKGPGNTGTHVGNLWTAAGTKLASVTFTAEGLSGWQQADFSAPVPIAAGQTYVASYLAPNGHYSVTPGQFASPIDNGPIHALADGDGGGNGVFVYGSAGGFPTGSWGATNYWVDVVFSAVDATPPTLMSQTPGPGASSVPLTGAVAATFSEDVQPATIALDVSGPAGAVPGTLAYDAPSRTVTFTPTAALTSAQTYTVTVSGTRDVAGNLMSPVPVTWSFTTAGACPCSVFATDAAPAVPAEGDPGPLTVGMRFTPITNGTVTAIRFYKGPGNTGTHVGTLWSDTGTALATVTFNGETASGWQVATLSTPVAVSAGVDYVVSYHAPNGRYASTAGFFASPYSNGPLQGKTGLYVYGATGAFPAASSTANYWVDVVFSPAS